VTKVTRRSTYSNVSAPEFRLGRNGVAEALQSMKCSCWMKPRQLLVTEFWHTTKYQNLTTRDHLGNLAVDEPTAKELLVGSWTSQPLRASTDAHSPYRPRRIPSGQELAKAEDEDKTVTQCREYHKHKDEKKRRKIRKQTPQDWLRPEFNAWGNSWLKHKLIIP
jgi:hypothetical protein